MARKNDYSLYYLAAAGAGLYFYSKNKGPAVAEVPSNVVEQPVGLLPNTPQGLPILSQPTPPVSAPLPSLPGGAWTQFGPVSPSVFTPTQSTNDPNAPPVVTPPTAPVGSCSTPPVVTDSNHRGAPFGGASLNITCQAATSGAGIPGFAYTCNVNLGRALAAGEYVEWYNARTGSLIGRTIPGITTTPAATVNMWRGVQTTPVDVVAFVQRAATGGDPMSPTSAGTVAATEVRRIPVTA
jgi:hypothetical protein